MFKFLNRLAEAFSTPTEEPITVYTAEEIQAAITAEVIVYMKSLKKEILEQKLPEEIEEEYQLLQSTGFRDSANMKRIEELKDLIETNNSTRKRNIEAVKFISELYSTFGDSCSLIKFEDFLYLLNKYNLACGEFEDYTGTIPLKNLREINEVKENFNKIHARVLNVSGIKKVQAEETKWAYDNNYDDMFYPWTAANVRIVDMFGEEDEDDYIYDNPILHKHFKPIHKIFRVYNKDIILPEEKEQLLRFPFVIEGDPLKVNRYSDSRVADTNLFICAPVQELKNKIEFTDRVKSEDPFICSYTDLGIVIFSKWGNEANDEIFKRYDELKQLINEKVRKA